jgi:hypothetical protein
MPISKIVIMVLVLASLGPGKLRALGQAEAVSFDRQGNSIQVAIGGKPFTTYHFEPGTAKAYLQPLRTASGLIVTRGFHMSMIPTSSLTSVACISRMVT